MGYVEFLRVRQALIFYTGIIAIVVVLILIIVSSQHTGGSVTVVVGTGAETHPATSVSGMFEGVRIPLGILLGIAGYAAVVFATVLASSLNKENAHAHFSLTKPLSRERLGLAYFAVDAVGIALAFVIAFLLIAVLPLIALGVMSHVYFDPQAIWIGALGLGIAYMWYGVLQAATSGYAGRGGTVVGVSWALFAILASLSNATLLGPILLGIVHLVNLLNPLAYFSSLTTQHGNDVQVRSTLGIALEPRTLLAWAVAFAAGAVALTRQKRFEV